MILLLYGKYLTTEIKHCCIYIPAQLKCVYQCKPGKQAHVLNVMLSVLHGSLPDAQRIPETLSILFLQFSGIIKNIGGGCGSACPSETEVEYLQRRFRGIFTIIQKACGKTSIISKHCQFNMFDLIYFVNLVLIENICVNIFKQTHSKHVLIKVVELQILFTSFLGLVGIDS